MEETNKYFENMSQHEIQHMREHYQQQNEFYNSLTEADYAQLMEEYQDRRERIITKSNNIIKNGSYHYVTSQVKVSYEDKVNEILNGFDFDNQKSVNQMVSQQNKAQEILDRNNNQDRVSKMLMEER